MHPSFFARKNCMECYENHNHSIKEFAMNEAAKKALARSKKFVSDHRVGIAIVITAACGVALNRSALRSHDNFLKEKGLYDEFYAPPEEEPVVE